MKRPYIAFFTWLNCSLLCCPMSPLISSSAADSKNAVVVGLSAPLTGDGAAIGTAVKNGVQMKFEELPKEVQDRIKLSIQDDQNSPKNAVTAFTKLVKSDKATVIISTASNTSKATAPLADREGIPQISIATDTAVSSGRKYVVNFWASASEEAKPAFEEAQRRGYKKIAIVSATHDFALACRKAFEEENQGRIAVVLSDEYAPEVKDFRPFLTKLRAAGEFDAIFVNLFLGQIGLFAKQARELGFKQDLFTFELFEDPNEVKISNGALLDQWYAQADDPNEEFLKKYKSKFPTASNLGAANGYDALGLIALAIQAGKESSDEINEFIHQVKDVTGALGTYSATGKNTFSLPATLKVVTVDGFEKLGKRGKAIVP